MKKDKEKKDTQAAQEAAECVSSDTLLDEIETLKRSLEEKTKESDGYFDSMKRLAAEFDNFRKRTSREKEMLYCDAVADTIAAVLPVLDNLERALAASNADPATLKDGVEMVLKQLKTNLMNVGVEEIPAVGECFNPDLHNAVMHEESDEHSASTVVEEFQKGFKYKDKVIRHSMVKVVN